MSAPPHSLSRFLFRKDFTADPEQVAQVMELDEREAIQDRSLLIRRLIVLALVLIAFTLHSLIQLEPSVVALLGAGLLVAISGLRPQTYLVDIEWETLLFFAGLFILVKTGVIDHLAAGLVAATRDSVPAAMTLILWGPAALSAIVDNIPFRRHHDAGRRPARKWYWAVRWPEWAVVGTGSRSRSGR